MLNSAERSFLKTWLCYSIPKLFVEFLIVRAVLLWIFWTFVAILIEKKTIFFHFLHLILILVIHICIASDTKLSFASV